MSPSKSHFCNKCNSEIKTKGFMNCSVCNNDFDLECCGITSKRFYSFYAFNPEKKKIWKCNTCKNKNAIPKKLSKKFNLNIKSKTTSTPINSGPCVKNLPALEESMDTPRTTHQVKALNSDSESNNSQQGEITNSMIGHSIISPQNNTMEYITIRGKKGLKRDQTETTCLFNTSNTFVNENSFSALLTLNQTHHQSLPEIGDILEKEDVEKLKQDNETLKKELEGYKTDIIKLIIDKSKLEMELARKNTHIKKLQHICSTPNLATLLDDTNNAQDTELDEIPVEHIHHDSKSDMTDTYKTNSENVQDALLLQRNKIKELYRKISKLTSETLKLKNKLEIMKTKDVTLSKLRHTSRILQKQAMDIVQKYDDNVKTKQNVEITQDTNSKESSTVNNENVHKANYNLNYFTDDKRPKLLLISDFHGAELISKINKIRNNDYETRADIIYHGSTKRVLQGLEDKTQNFNKGDCVVIMCGSCDISDSNPDLKQIVKDYKETLGKLANTNVIVCNIPGRIGVEWNDYNKCVQILNDMFKNEFGKLDNVFMTSIDNNLTPFDFCDNGYKLKNSGKFKTALAINMALKKINLKFYNGLSFLGKIISNRIYQ